MNPLGATKNPNSFVESIGSIYTTGSPNPEPIPQSPAPEFSNPALPTIASQPIVQTIAGIPFSISRSQVIVGTQTILPGNPAITYSNTPISLGPSATALVIGSSTFNLAPSNGPIPAPTLNFGGTVYTENSASVFIIGSQTLQPGSAIVIDGTTVSLASGATAAVIGGSSVPLATFAPDGDEGGSLSAVTGPEALTFGGSIYVANSASMYVVGGQTLTQKGAVTVDGTVISLAPGGTEVIVGSSTETLGVVVATTGPPIGGAIWSVFNGGTGNGGSATATASRGEFAVSNAKGKGVRKEQWLLLALMGSVYWVIQKSVL